LSSFEEARVEQQLLLEERTGDYGNDENAALLELELGQTRTCR
jgi:hypothetical protein